VVFTSLFILSLGMQTPSIADWEEKFTDYLRSHADLEDGSHDLGHFQRVWKTAQLIDREDGLGADLLILLAAAYFHDLVALPKNHPERSRSSLLSADKTAELLVNTFTDFPAEKIEGVRHVIHAHSFSANIPTRTVEARILQDADRLEALGAIGLARVFYTCGQLSQQLFDPVDPLADHRVPNDQVFALDHFSIKLLKLPDLMNTKAGRRLADENADYLRGFLQKIRGEILGI